MGNDQLGLEQDPIHTPDNLEVNHSDSQDELWKQVASVVSAANPQPIHNSESQGADFHPTVQGSVQSWLQVTADGILPTSSSSRKRKRSESSTGPLSTPPSISETFLNLEEVEFEMPPKTPDSKAAKVSNLSDDQAWIKQRLEQHRMFQDNRKAFELYPDFEAEVRAIIGGDRNSLPRPQSIKNFQKKFDHTRLLNEDTFLDHIIPLLIPESREMLPKYLTEGPNNTLPNPEQPLPVEDFWESGVFRARNVHFRPGFLPEDPELAAKMRKNKEKEEGQTNPRPDYVYGILPNCHEPPKGITLSPVTEYNRQVIPYLHDPMLFLEGKGDKGKMGEAMNQACRGGAAVLRAGRTMREKIGQQDVEGPDRRTFLFSGTISPSVMHIWVHWAEIQNVEDADMVVKESGTKGKESDVNAASQCDDQVLPEDGQDSKGKGKAGNTTSQGDAQGLPGDGKGARGERKADPKKTKIVNYHMNMLESESVAGIHFLERMRPICLNILDWGSLDRFNSNLKQYYQDIYDWEKKQAAFGTGIDDVAGSPPSSKRPRMGA